MTTRPARPRRAQRGSFAVLLACPALAAAAPGGAIEPAEPVELAGFYHVTPAGIGAGHSDHFALYADGRWAFGNDYECSVEVTANMRTVRARAGRWAVKDGMIVLREEGRDLLVGGHCRCDAVACRIEGALPGTRPQTR